MLPFDTSKNVHFILKLSTLYARLGLEGLP
jgi:hypothetical protein